MLPQLYHWVYHMNKKTSCYFASFKWPPKLLHLAIYFWGFFFFFRLLFFLHAHKHTLTKKGKLTCLDIILLVAKSVGTSAWLLRQMLLVQYLQSFTSGQWFHWVFAPGCLRNGTSDSFSLSRSNLLGRWTVSQWQEFREKLRPSPLFNNIEDRKQSCDRVDIGSRDHGLETEG